MNDGVAAAYRWTSAHRTHVGKVRALNEDSVLDRPEIGLWVVADGMGGHAGGDRASRMVIDALAALPAPGGLDGFVAAVVGELDAVNARLYEEIVRGGVENLSGTTAAVLLAHGRQGVAVWAGDSRIYLYRNNTLHALSRDHSQMEEWVASGLLDPHSARNHPAAHVITRAVGAAERVELDTARFDMLPGDVFLLCSDGLHNELSERTIATTLADADCERCADRLLAATLAGDARDNVSLIVVRVEANGEDATRTVINPAFLQPGDET